MKVRDEPVAVDAAGGLIISVGGTTSHSATI